VEDGKITLKSRGDQMRSFVGTRDLARMVELLLFRDLPLPPVVNAVGKEHLSVYEFATLCASIFHEKTGKQATVERPEGDAAGGDPLKFECRSLDYSPQDTLETFVAELISYQLKQKK